MQALRQFSIPFKGLKNGTHEYEFDIDENFFKEFEDSPIELASLKARLELEKKNDHFILYFEADGTIQTECDRCTATIDLPMDFDFEYIVKFDEDEREEDEVVYIHPESHHIHVGPMLYEQILLAIPLIKVYDCQDEDPVPCNEKVLEILNSEEEGEINNPLGDVLKDLKITKTK